MGQLRSGSSTPHPSTAPGSFWNQDSAVQGPLLSPPASSTVLTGALFSQTLQATAERQASWQRCPGRAPEGGVTRGSSHAHEVRFKTSRHLHLPRPKRGPAQAECQSHAASFLNNVIQTVCELHQEMDTEVDCNRLTLKLGGGEKGRDRAGAGNSRQVINLESGQSLTKTSSEALTGRTLMSSPHMSTAGPRDCT